MIYKYIYWGNEVSSKLKNVFSLNALLDLNVHEFYMVYVASIPVGMIKSVWMVSFDNYQGALIIALRNLFHVLWIIFTCSRGYMGFKKSKKKIFIIFS